MNKSFAQAVGTQDAGVEWLFSIEADDVAKLRL